MSRGGARAGIAGAALAALLLAPGSWGQPPGSIPPVYAQRLQIPVRGDNLQQPRAVVADLHSGEVLVCDTLANRIVIFDPQGGFRYEIHGGAMFQSPIDLAVDPEGYLFVVSQTNSEVTLLDFDGRLLRKAPLTGLPDGAISPRFASLAISPAGDRLYLMDHENDRLWITDRQLAVQGSVDTTVGRTPKEIEELRYGHVDVYGETVLLPIPNDGLVHMFDLEGRVKGTIGARGSAECQLMFPAAAALDEQGRVLVLDLQRAMFMTWDLERGACLSEHYGFGNAPGALYQPSDLALDAAGRLYVSQGFEGRVQVYEGARPAPVLIAARPTTPEISEESLIADTAEFEADVGAQLEQTVRAWARAWAGKRTDEYLAFYSPDFQPGGGVTRPQWERQRRDRLDRPSSIQVSLGRLEPRLTAPDRAEISFAQTYRSDLFADKVDKVLSLGREADGWKILAERVVGSHPDVEQVEAEVEQTVRAWARAWAGRRLEEYLAFYSPGFRPSRDLSRSQWESQRRARLERPRFIEVSVERVEPRPSAPDRAQVSFVQTYHSDLFADKVDKILTLRREADGWKILAERVVRAYRE